MAIGRPIEYDLQQVLDAATRAFWAKGYEATSMQELLDATRLSKSSLYQAFGGKQALFGRCIAAYSDRMVAQLREGLDAAASPLAFIKFTLLEVAGQGAANPAPMGCLVMNTAAEFGQREPEFAAWVDAGITRVRAVLELAVKRGQAAGEIGRARSARALADYLMTVVAGLRTLVKAGAPTKALVGVVELAVSTLR